MAGIDFGSKRVVIGLFMEAESVQGARVEVIDSMAGGMQAPACVTWAPGEKRIIGKQAFNQRNRKREHTVSFPLRLLDVSILADEGRMEYEKKFLNHDSHLNMCRIRQAGTVEKKSLDMDIEQVVACFFKLL